MPAKLKSAKRPSMAVSSSESGRAYRILAVDDEPDILTIIKMSLERYKHSVDVFSNPVKALSHFEKNPNYDLVITDIRMPYMTGYELASRLRQIDKSIKVVLVTAFDVDANVLKNILPSVGIDGVLRKPSALTEICSIVEHKLTSG
jgi:CheY-like chemotaxis protein